MSIIDPATNSPGFWPWPTRDWLFNKPALDAINIVSFMQRLLKKSGELWTDNDNEFYRAIHTKPEVVQYERDNVTL